MPLFDLVLGIGFGVYWYWGYLLLYIGEWYHSKIGVLLNGDFRWYIGVIGVFLWELGMGSYMVR